MSIKLVIALAGLAIVFALIFRSFWNSNEISSKDDLAKYDSGQAIGGGD